MRIALVCGHFMPEIGYQEVNLAKAFASLGHIVGVFTSNKVSPSSKKVIKVDYLLGQQKDTINGYQILRLPLFISWGSGIICRGLKKEVLAFHPDLVAIIGIGKVFGYSLLQKKDKRSYKLISFFGDNSDFFNWSSLFQALRSVKKVIVQKTLKKRLYRKSVKTCDRLVLYTPETENILSSLLSKKLRQNLSEKVIHSTLGFDAREFYFDEKERREMREQLGFKENDCVLITSTRITPAKKLEKIIAIVSELQLQGKMLHYILVGFLNDPYEQELKKIISKQPSANNFKCFKFSDQPAMRRFYNAADIGLWNNAAISIQQAMGTGLPVILEDKPSVNHLIKKSVNGWSYNKNDFAPVLTAALMESTKIDIKKRKDIREFNFGKISYEKISEKIINSIKSDI